MKTNLKKMLALTALSMALLSTTVPTWAGSKKTREVFLHSNQTGWSASGSMVGARYSADNNQSIGCSTYFRPNSPYSLETWCQARNSAGALYGCASADPRHLETVQGISDSSYLYFETQNTGPAGCSRIVIYNGSDQLK